MYGLLFRTPLRPVWFSPYYFVHEWKLRDIADAACIVGKAMGSRLSVKCPVYDIRMSPVLMRMNYDKDTAGAGEKGMKEVGTRSEQVSLDVVCHLDSRLLVD